MRALFWSAVISTGNVLLRWAGACPDVGDTPAPQTDAEWRELWEAKCRRGTHD